MRDIRNEIEGIINEIMEKEENKYNSIVVETKFRNIDDEDFFDCLLNLTMDLVPTEEIETRIKEELGIIAKIEEQCFSLDEIIPIGFRSYDDESANIERCCIYFNIETENHKLFDLILCYSVEISPIYLDFPDENDEENNSRFIEISTNEYKYCKTNSKFSSKFKYAEIQINEEDEY